MKLLSISAAVGCLPVVACIGVASPASTIPVPHIELKRVPDGGIQPQTAVDQDGTVHLVYFKGDPSAGDLF